MSDDVAAGWKRVRVRLSALCGPVLAVALVVSSAPHAAGGSEVAAPTEAPTVTAVSTCAEALPRLRRRCLAVAPLGHRGREYPAATTNENTIAALAHVGSIGAGCETDTWRLASDDGAPNQGISVIFHDETLGRVVSSESLKAAGVSPTTYIGDVTRAQFNLLRTKGGEPLPTLQEWIRYAAEHRIPCSIEIKWAPADPSEVAGWITQYGGERYISFNQRPLSATGRWPCSLVALNSMRDAGIRTGLKTAADCPMSLQEIHNAGYLDVFADQELLTAAYIRRAQSLCLNVGNKVSDDPTIWKGLVRRNADFIIAARPRALVKWLGQDRRPANPAAAVATPQSMRTAQRYKLVWADEFNGTRVNSRKWNVRDDTYLDYDMAILTARRKNVSVSDGKLTIRSRREQRTVGKETRDYTSGYLDTIGKRSWLYGRFSIRAKLPTEAGISKGIWPAFWLRPEGGGVGEIDVLEAIGSDAPSTECNKVHVTIHHDYLSGRRHRPMQTHTVRFPGGTTPSDGFHTYTVEWLPGRLIWSIDGAEVWRRSRRTTAWFDEAFSRPYNIRLNQQVGGSWPGAPTTATAFPADYKVDWVRVYQKR